MQTATGWKRWTPALGLLAAMMLGGAAGAAAQKVSLDDPPGDDNGPGKYVYPTDPVYSPGTFDLIGFNLKAHKDTLDLEVSMKNKLEDPWQTGSGFSLQMVLIFLQTNGPEQAPALKDRKTLRAERKAAKEKATAEKAAAKAKLIAEGNQAAADALDKQEPKPAPKVRKPYGFVDGLPGLNLAFAPSDGWDHCIVLSPLPAARVAQEIAAKVPAALRGAILVPARVRASGRDILATVDRKALGKNDPRTWGYQVVVVGSDPFPGPRSLLIRPVADAESPLRFGGAEGDCAPNALDTLADDASGDAHEADLQHDELQYECNPNGTPKKLATLKLVYVPDDNDQEKANAQANTGTSVPGAPVPPPPQ